VEDLTRDVGSCRCKDVRCKLYSRLILCLEAYPGAVGSAWSREQQGSPWRHGGSAWNVEAHPGAVKAHLKPESSTLSQFVALPGGALGGHPGA
jgi:hypothetical protein